MTNESEIIDGSLTTYKRAWLITWQWSGDHAKVDDAFVALLDYRYAPMTIKRFIEWVYMGSNLSFFEQIAYAKRRSNNPYPAQYGTIRISGSDDLGMPTNGPWQAQIICGHNPWLYARLIHDVVAYVDKSGSHHLRWKERVSPVFEKGEIKSDWEEHEIVRE
jgi:hypothetical protein